MEDKETATLLLSSTVLEHENDTRPTTKSVCYYVPQEQHWNHLFGTRGVQMLLEVEMRKVTDVKDMVKWMTFCEADDQEEGTLQLIEEEELGSMNRICVMWGKDSSNEKT